MCKYISLQINVYRIEPYIVHNVVIQTFLMINEILRCVQAREDINPTPLPAAAACEMWKEPVRTPNTSVASQGHDNGQGSTKTYMQPPIQEWAENQG